MQTSFSLIELLRGFVLPDGQVESQSNGQGDGVVNMPALNGLSVSNLALDSRKVQRGDLFLAMPGTQTSGERFIEQAIENGAAGVVIDADAPFDIRRPYAVPVLRVQALKRKAGDIAARFFANPSDAMRVIGVTGTNGKTTCAHFLAQACSALDKPSGFIGTLGVGLIDDVKPGALTTPDVISLQREFKNMLANGAQYVALEASSHGLDQHRLNGVSFNVGVFTNLTHDHLDYHANMRAYGEAKARLFDFISMTHAVINVDDEFGHELANRVKTKHVWRYGLAQGDFQLVSSTLSASGIRAVFKTPAGNVEFSAPVIGRFNLYNFLAVAAVLHAEGFSRAQIQIALCALQSVPGRMQTVFANAGSSLNKTKMPIHPGVIVDYSHTPDSLRNAMASAREHTTGRLWLVFGCGGDRDKRKRPVMGEIAQRLADVAIITDDNPRNESAVDITNQIAAGFKKTGLQPLVISNRGQAIKHAIQNANAEDVVLIAGKGHETSLTIGDKTIEFSDVEKARAALAQRERLA